MISKLWKPLKQIIKMSTFETILNLQKLKKTVWSPFRASQIKNSSMRRLMKLKNQWRKVNRRYLYQHKGFNLQKIYRRISIHRRPMEGILNKVIRTRPQVADILGMWALNKQSRTGMTFRLNKRLPMILLRKCFGTPK